MVLDFQYDELLIPDGLILNRKAGEICYGYAVPLRYPSYRGTFVSCIEALEAEVDGTSVAQSDMRFELNGKQFLLSELGELFKEHWFVLATAHLVVMKDGGLPAGQHSVKIRMKHRIPYTGYFGQYLVLDSVCEKALECA